MALACCVWLFISTGHVLMNSMHFSYFIFWALINLAPRLLKILVIQVIQTILMAWFVFHFNILFYFINITTCFVVLPSALCVLFADIYFGYDSFCLQVRYVGLFILGFKCLHILTNILWRLAVWFRYCDTFVDSLCSCLWQPFTYRSLVISWLGNF